MAKQCPNCNTFLTSRAKYCRICGLGVPETSATNAVSIAPSFPPPEPIPDQLLAPAAQLSANSVAATNAHNQAFNNVPPIVNDPAMATSPVMIGQMGTAAAGGSAVGLPATVALVPPTEVLPPPAARVARADHLPATELLPLTGTLAGHSTLLLAPPTHALIGGFTQAGFTLRLAALMLDVLLLLGVLLLASFLTSACYSLWAGALLLSYPLTLMFGFYNHLIRVQTTGQTLGKYWIGIRVLSRDLQPATPRQLWIRTLLGYPVALLPVGLGWLWLLWDRRQQGWHDHLANTIVVKLYPE